MIHEIATLTIEPARAATFEAAVAMARPHFEAAKGFVSFALQRSVENPARYHLVVGWESVEAHMVDFRESEGFQAWRALAGPFFVEAPSVEHFVQAC
ncbi:MULTISPECIES: antibiotic biosynthesis monooxygenase family protein [Novosphingobium]|uniref:antibiotic biosynthesis monooxygenase family protein n=1 Tax=Novosphingobium sp. TaxID=1874826 RepID=UPI0012C255A0|nr:antibiotic biosynthesis monooxygenase family protein [Novosphingobium sp.]MPS69743.1 antibiotic biosynthesis monooxygenase [Novosphingobium sp.]